MSRIKIKNFGPIKDGFTGNDSWIDIRKVTVLIGDQGSGKSTVAKLVSTFAWIEKDLFRSGGSTLELRTQEKDFIRRLAYHRISSYLTSETEIEYEGGAYTISYTASHNLVIDKIKHCDYLLPKITYYPAERNFVSSVKKISENSTLRLWSPSMQEFKDTYKEAKNNLKEKESLELPISDVSLEYNKLNDILYIKGEDYKVQLSDSSSGFQSFVPLFVVSNYISTLLTDGQEMDEHQRETFRKQSAIIQYNKDYTEEQKRILLSNLAAKFNIKRTLNIIEEPEQNLFPTSQRQVLNKLLGFNNMAKDNQLIMTTHSPYLISYLTLAIQAYESSITAKNDRDVKEQIYSVVPEQSLIASEDVAVYELDNSGSVRKLEQINSLPSDEHYLNEELGKTNELFSKLLELEDVCRK